DEEEIAKIDEPKDTESGGDDEETKSNGESKQEETREEEEESFDLIPRTPEDSENDGNGEEDQGLRISEEERIHEEEEADELYRDVDINQGRGLQVSQVIEDSHVTLTPVHSDGQQESSEDVRMMIRKDPPLDQTRGLRDEEKVGSMHQPVPHLSQLPGVQAGLLQGLNLDRCLPVSLLLQRNLCRLPVRWINPHIRCLKQVQKINPLFKLLSHASASTPSETATGSAGRSTTGSQSRQLSASESAFAEEHVQTTCQMEEPPHLAFEIGADDQPIVQTSQHPEWFSQPRRPPSPDRDWNKTLPAAQGDAQSWISDLARQTDARSSFNELLDTPIDFSNFIMNRLGVATLTLKLLAGPTYELIRGRVIA
nr:hypothetical protein [Tanacetum cinerariifolium]